MAQLKWDVAGKHYYENGVDHGILFVKNEDGSYSKGVVWDGLSSVSLSPEGAEPNDIYADNIKYLSILSVESLKGTIEAYQAPKEFNACDGLAEASETVSGVTLGQQTRKQFALCFRSKVGSDSNPELGYKLHIVYGCFASPSEEAYETINDSPEAITKSWEVSTTPVEVEGFKPTASITIDSTKFTEATKAKLEEIEARLYGTDDTDSELLLPSDIINILEGIELESLTAELADESKEYHVDDEINKEDFIVKAHYSDGSEATVNDYECNVTLPYTFVSGDVGTKSFTFTKGDATISLNVTVEA